jgi:hypothetical protein
LPNSISSAGVRRGTLPMLAKYQLMGSLPLLRLLSTTESEVAVIEKFLELKARLLRFFGLVMCFQ